MSDAEVKPLVWEPHPVFGGDDLAVARVAEWGEQGHKYQVGLDADAPGYKAFLAPLYGSWFWTSAGHASLEEAKAAAQSDYEARIRSALVSTPPAVPVRETPAPALDWSNFEGPKRNVEWKPDDQDLIYTAINYRDDEYGDADEDVGQQLVERLLAAWRSSVISEQLTFEISARLLKERDEAHAALSASPSPVDSRDAREVSTGVLNDMLLARAPDCRWTIASILKERGLNYRQRLDYMRAALSAALAAKEQQP